MSSVVTAFLVIKTTIHPAPQVISLDYTLQGGGVCRRGAGSVRDYLQFKTVMLLYAGLSTKTFYCAV